MGKYHVKSCADIESCLYFELMIGHLRFFFSRCFLKFILTCVLFLCVCVCVYVCTHVQPLATAVVPVHTEADFFLWVYWKLLNILHSSLIPR